MDRTELQESGDTIHCLGRNLRSLLDPHAIAESEDVWRCGFRAPELRGTIKM